MSRGRSGARRSPSQHRRHRHVEFQKFRGTIDREVSKRLRIHLILDYHATRNHPNMKACAAVPVDSHHRADSGSPGIDVGESVVSGSARVVVGG
jgi:hypothetical protein